MNKLFAALLFCIFIFGVIGCVDKSIEESGTQNDMSSKSIEQVLGENTGRWLKMDLVVGVAIGMLDDKPCIRILVASDAEKVRKQVPENVEGYPVIVEVTGSIKARE
jgi:hypothetical protein